MHLIFNILFWGCSPSSSIENSAFMHMHKKVYQVYQVPLNRTDIHKLLAEIFMGEALSDEYVEHFTSRVHMKEEDTQIEIKQIDYNQISVLEELPQQVKIDADWSVGGIVTHQKHKHPRVNRYRAIFTLQKNNANQWRIVDTKMRNAERMQRAGVRDEDFFEGKKSTGGYLDPLDLINSGVMDEPGD